VPVAESFDWLKPSPLWRTDLADVRQADFFAPRLLEFASDAFVDEFLAEVAAPDVGRRLAARFLAPPAEGQLPKLFQPNHGRFYLVCGSLCCRVPGFPDSTVRAADGENVFFVLRKLIDGAEFAWAIDAGKPGWQPLNGDPRRLLEGEERQPLFTAAAGNGRSLHFGYVSVASRETYAVEPSELPDETARDPRLEELASRVATAIEVVEKAEDAVPLPVSVYLYLDLWEFFDDNLPAVASALLDGIATPPFTGEKATEEADLFAFLRLQRLGGAATLAGALGLAGKHREALNQTGGAEPSAVEFTDDYNLRGKEVDTATLQAKVGAALGADRPAVEFPKLEARADAPYALRLVYERPRCDPPVRVVSVRSDEVRLAAFFDADAPTRPVRITLPTDVSPAGMRKFKQNVTFLMSDSMRKQVRRIEGFERKLLGDDPEVGDPDSDGVAFVCSFSIQIIFIVAFFLLLMFVIILNIVFWWIAFFKICLPVPKRLLPY
jgi:hypothetical protein